MPSVFASPEIAATHRDRGKRVPTELLAGYIPPMTKEGPPDQEVHGSLEAPIDTEETARRDLPRVLIEVSVIPKNGIGVALKGSSAVVGRHGRHFPSGRSIAYCYLPEAEELAKLVVPDDAWAHCKAAHEIYLAELEAWLKEGHLDEATGLPIRDAREFGETPQSMSARLRTGGLGGKVRYLKILETDLPRHETPEKKARDERNEAAEQSTAAVRELMAGLPAALAAAVKAAIDAKGSTK